MKNLIIFNCTMLTLLVGTVVYTFSLAYESATADTQELELFYMYGDQTGAYFLEPKAEYENVIYVPSETLDNLPNFPTELGERFTGTFDKTGWELLTIQHKEEK